MAIRILELRSKRLKTKAKRLKSREESKKFKVERARNWGFGVERQELKNDN